MIAASTEDPEKGIEKDKAKQYCQNHSYRTPCGNGASLVCLLPKGRGAPNSIWP